MTKVLLIGTAGFVGTLARYFLQGVIQTNAGSAFPFGTLVVNLSGCFVLGLLNGLFTDRFLIDPQWRICFTIGFCGAFTMFSTLAFETVQLASGREFFWQQRMSLQVWRSASFFSGWGSWQHEPCEVS